jgi:hypothetical protein
MHLKQFLPREARTVGAPIAESSQHISGLNLIDVTFLRFTKLHRVGRISKDLGSFFWRQYNARGAAQTANVNLDLLSDLITESHASRNSLGRPPLAFFGVLLSDIDFVIR